ncbi:CHAT domain-containing protein [Mycena latifolia]|nr:CHAT domain-containing protein [Mycena latifolia]
MSAQPVPDVPLQPSLGPKEGNTLDVSDTSGSSEMQRIQELIKDAPAGHPDLPKYYQMLGDTYRQEYQNSGGLNNLDAALENYQLAVTLTEEGHPDRLEGLKKLGASFRDRYKESGVLEDLEMSLKRRQELVDLTPKGHSDRAGQLQSLAVSLRDRYQKLGDLADLEAALKRKQESVALTPEGDPARAARLKSLAVSFTDRYRRLGDLEDLEAALQMDREAVDLTPKEDPSRAVRLQSLSVSFTDRYHRLGDIGDLEAAIQLDQEAVNLTPRGHPDRPGYMQSLAASFTNRFQRLGDPNDLDAALQLDQEVVNLTPEGHPKRAERLQGLAISFEDRYRLLGDLNDLEAVLQMEQEVVNITPEGHPHKAQFQHNLGATFGNRYRRLGDLSDLEAALHRFQEAVRLTPEGHPDRSSHLHSLAMSFGDRHKRLGDLGDLNAALKNGQEAVDLTPDGHPDRTGYLESLSDFFGQKYQRLGDLADLESALEMIEEVVNDIPDGHPDRAQYLQGLAILLKDRYQRLGDLEDLEAALQMGQEVIDLTPKEHPSRANRLQSLAESYICRYQRLGELDDLETALQKDKEAVDITPVGHRARAEHLQNLAASLAYRYRRLGNLNDLEAVVQANEEAFKLTPERHIDRAERLQNLALDAVHRYRRFRNPEDAEAVHRNYKASFETITLTPEVSWEQALVWASFAKEFQPLHCKTAYTAAFHLLPEILWIGHAMPVRQDAILRLNIGQATSTATRTCIEQKDFPSAVEIMEQGLATEFQQMLQLKTDVDKLHPEDAKLFQKLSSELYGGRARNPLHIVNERNQLLEKIREQPELKHFLLPKPYDVLSQAARGGPVVILNSHKDGCDAIIILDPMSGPLHVPLLDVPLELLESHRAMLKQLLSDCNVRTRGESESSRLFGQQERFTTKSINECFADLLSWLWANVVGPIYQVLGSKDIHSGRLWWLPTGAFTGLPLHASTPADKFIHSYTATLGALLESYNKKPSSTVPKFGVVGVTHTGPGRTHSLKGVEQEVQKILSIVRGPLECLQGEQATPDAVKLQIKECSWVHLACHGIQDLIEPSKSHLKLYQGNLELETILRTPLPNAEFVFLAACQTAMGDAELVNESFHLGGGFIVAGFRGAIGTLWAMNDRDGPQVAQIVYSHLCRDGKWPQASEAAEALQLAVNELKARKVSYERWIPFIHMGI